jgi:predicted nucleic acid-binding protein
MNLFIDTSSLVKRYVDKINSDKVDELFFKSDSIEISAITKIELNSALDRRLADKSIDKKACQMALDEFDRECIYFNILPFNSIVEQEAIRLIKKNQMKTLDAVQLASAVLSSRDAFTTSDKRLYEFAAKELPVECILI